MSSLNRVLLMGNCTRDSELRYTPGGMAIASFGIAMNRKYKDSKGELKEEVTFVDVDMWGQQGERAHENLRKGALVFIEGRLKFDQWDDKTTGQKRSKLKVVADRLQFASTASHSQPQAPPAAQATTAPSETAPAAPDESVPF